MLHLYPQYEPIKNDADPRIIPPKDFFHVLKSCRAAQSIKADKKKLFSGAFIAMGELYSIGNPKPTK
jgi:hypothetical protein